MSYPAIIPVTQEPLTQEQRERVHEETLLMAEIVEAANRGDVHGVIRRAELLSWIHYGPHT